MKPISFIIISIFCLTQAADASEPIIHYTVENSGLGSNHIQDILLTEDGTVWFVHNPDQNDETTVCISGHTGNEWIHITLDDFVISDMYPDSENIRRYVNDVKSFGNILYIATNVGVFTYGQGNMTRIPELSGFSFSSILPVANQQFWVCGSYSTWGNRDTISLYDSGSVTSYYIDNWGSSHPMLGYDENSNLWTSGGNNNAKGLFRFDGEHWIWLSQDIYGDGMLALPDGKTYLYSMDIEHTILDNTQAYQVQDVHGNSVLHDNSIWSVSMDVLYNIEADTVYEYELFEVLESVVIPGYFESVYIAFDDSSAWLGSNDQGIIQVNYEYLISLAPDRTSPLDLELFAEIPESPPVYGTDYEFFPMHIGDTWTYSRSMHKSNIVDSDTTTYHDTICHTIIDTVWVDGNVSFQFLNGQQFHVQSGTNIIYDDDKVRFDFNAPEESTFLYHSPYYPGPGDMTRYMVTLELPAGQFQGYSFGFAYWPGGQIYATIPHIGIARWQGSGDTPQYERIELLSATIGDKSIDEIVAVEEPVSYPLKLTTHPNPFNPRTTISYTLPTPSEVTLSVYAITGQKVATLVDGPMAAGTHAAVFDGEGLASGLYVARLEANGAVQTRKMLLVK